MQSVNKRVAAGYKRSRIALYSLLTPLLAFSLLGTLDSVKRFAFIVLGFSLIIFLHELGHFLVARACSVKCLAFSIGIGPRMLGWRKGRGLTFGKDPYEPDNKDLAHKAIEDAEGAAAVADLPQSASAPPHPASVGDCDYRVSWLPLGGYVRMLGQDDMDPTKVSRDPRAFNMRPVWQRMCIVSAGVIMNLIFAAVTFSIIFSPSIGVNFPPAHIGPVAYGQPAYKAGMKIGDEIVAINHKRDLGFVEFTDVQIACALSDGSEAINFQWKRALPGGGEILMDKDITPVRPPDGGFLMIGVTPMPSLNIANSEEILTASIDDRRKAEAKDPAAGDEATELAKLRMHDHITALDGQPVHDYVELYDRLQLTAGKPITVTVHNDDSAIADRTLTLKPRLETRIGADRFPDVAGFRPRLKVAQVLDGQPAKAAGILDDDLLVLVGERANPDTAQLLDIVGKNANNAALPIAVVRNGERKMLSSKVSKEGKIGVIVEDDVNSARAGVPDRALAPDLEILNQADTLRIAAVDGKPVHSWLEIYGILKTKAAGDKVDLTLAAGPAPAPASTQSATSYADASTAPAGVTTTITVSPELAAALHDQTHYLANLPVETETRTQRADNTWGAVVMGAQHTRKFILQVYMTLRGLFIHTISPTNLHGIVGITKIGYDIQERGHVWLWYVLAMVSVNLAVANFLPLPIVDGGLFLLLILEKIRGKPLSLKVQSAIQIVGIVLLAGLFLFVTFNDVSMIIHGK